MEGRQQSLDWTGLEWTELEMIVSNTDTISIGLCWKKSSKNNVALSLQLRVHKLYVEQAPTVVGVMSKSPGRLDWKRLSATHTLD